MATYSPKVVAVARATTATGVALILIMTLTAAVPSVGDTSSTNPRPGRIELSGSRVIPYEEHPASSIVDTDTRKLVATRHIPGYGGAYVDPKTEALHVWLTQPTLNLGSDARAALSRFTGPGPQGQREVVVHQAAYSFAQLKAWKDVAKDLFTLPETVMLGVSERDNRLLVGLQGHDELTTAAVQLLNNLDVPLEAVATMNMKGPPALALRDDHRPLTGGTQIQFQVGTGGFGTGTCTLGFPAVRDGVLGFVTNAHCSHTHGDVDDARYWQATRPFFDDNQVGTEVVDLPFFVNGPCPVDKVCTFADANYVRAHDGVAVNRGRIASVPCCGSLDWDGAGTWRVTDNFFTFVGNSVRKIGRTTGTTTGTVAIECVNTDVLDSPVHMLCQDIAFMVNTFGDSGSPVFEVTHSPAINDVRAVGINWGTGEDQEGNPLTFITPTPFIRDLITGPGLCAAGFGC